MRSILLVLIVVGVVSAHEDNFNEAKQLIDSSVSCDNLTDEQLEAIGEYYMEQMHPGEEHEIMDEMMGGEGSESLKQAHITMAEAFYCGNSMYGGMMGMGGWSMMDGMYYWGYGWSIWSVLYLVLIVGLIALVFLWIIKIWKEMKGKGRRK